MSNEERGKLDANDKSDNSKAVRPVLLEVDDSGSNRFNSDNDGLQVDIWVPGVIHVEFKDPEIPRKIFNTFGTSGIHVSNNDHWSEGLNSVLDKHGAVNWERTFPINSPYDVEDTVFEDPFADRRDKFITFFFTERVELTSAVRQLKDLPEIARAAPMPRLAPAMAINEPLLGNGILVQCDENNCRENHPAYQCLENQWYVFRCGIHEVWPHQISGRGVVLADIDWGFRINHQDLIHRIEFPFNTINFNSSVSNGNLFNHGTAVLGIAAAAHNGLGVAGIAYEASVWAIQAGHESSGYDILKEYKSWVAAIDCVRRRESQGRRKVIIFEAQTLKGGNAEMAVPINEAIRNAIEANLVICVVAGNRGTDAGIGDDHNDIPPTGSILVGATEYNADPTINRRANSNFGERITVYAPGDQHHDVTCSSRSKVGYRNCFGGTSGAAAKVGGVVALMLEANDQLTNEEIRRILRQTGSAITDDQGKPPGVFLNAKDAVCEALRLSGKPCFM